MDEARIEMLEVGKTWQMDKQGGAWPLFSGAS